MINKIALFTAICFFFVIQPVRAQDRCADILTNGTFQSSRIKNDNYMQQILQTRFLSSSYEQSKNDTKAGFGATLGSYFFEGDYDNSRFKQKQSQIQSELFNKVTVKNELDVALTSGDPEIVGAWQTCMTQKGGWLELRFTPKSGTKIFGEITWHPGQAGKPDGVAETTLEEDIDIAEGQVTQGKKCLSMQNKLTSKPCRFTILMPTAIKTLAVIANASHGSAEAFLPPRMLFTKESKPYLFKEADYLRRTWHRTNTIASGSASLNEQQITEGWVFEPSSAKVTLSAATERWVHNCASEKIVADLYSVHWEYKVTMSEKSSKDREANITCSVLPMVTLVRSRWVPMES